MLKLLLQERLITQEQINLINQYHLHSEESNIEWFIRIIGGPDRRRWLLIKK